MSLLRLAPALLLLAGLASAQEPAVPAALPPRYVVERIELQGLGRTRPSEVRRHLAVAPGDLLDDEAVLLSRLRLLQLGWFSRVETRVEKGSERGLVVLVLAFTERNTLVVSDLVLGSTGPQPFYGGLGLSDGNFLGRGLTLSGAFVWGGDPPEGPLAPARFAVRGAFLDPDLDVGALPLVFGISALALRGEEFACADPDCAAFRGRYGAAPRLRYDRLGGEVTAGLRPGPFERLLAGLRLERVGASPDAASAGTAPPVRAGRSFLTALTGGYDRDTRNDPFLPTDGTRLAVALTLASPALGGDYEYGRWLLTVESDHGLPWGHALKLTGAAGAVVGDAPFFERFYAADWAYFSVGPALGRALDLNFSTDPRYDAYLAMAGAEYAIPLWGAGRFFQRGYLALGTRLVHTAGGARAGRTRASRTPVSADVALRLDTPIGSFNVSMGYAVDNFL